MPPRPCIGQRPERTPAHCTPWTTFARQTLAAGLVRFTRIACFRCPLPTGKVSRAEADKGAFRRFRAGASTGVAAVLSCLCLVELGLKVKTK